MTQPGLIDHDEQLPAALELLRPAEVLAVDTEFLWERTYYPTLALVQVAGRDPDGAVHGFAIDPLRVELSPLLALLAEPGRLKVLHAGRIDLQIFQRLLGAPLSPVFDTQAAAALAGFGAQIGYANLVELTLGMRLAKTEQYADWTRRPLRPEQVEYALADVVPLLEVHDALRAQLSQAGRLTWAEEESAGLVDPDTYQEEPPELLFEKVKGRKSLDRRALAVLRELATWRDAEARRRDLRPGFVVRDPSLVELAARQPRRVDDLRAIRGLHPAEIKRHGGEIVAAIRRGLASDDLPSRPRRPKGRDVKAATDLLRAYLSQRAGEVGVAAETLATTAELERLARDGERERFAKDHSVLQGWRRELVGEDLLRILRGEVTVAIDPGTSALTLRPRD